MRFKWHCSEVWIPTWKVESWVYMHYLYSHTHTLYFFYILLYMWTVTICICTLNTHHMLCMSLVYILCAFIVLWESMRMNCPYSRPCFRAPYTSSTLLGCGSCVLLLLLDLCPHRWGFLGFVKDFFCAAEFPMNELHLETHINTHSLSEISIVLLNLQ